MEAGLEIRKWTRLTDFLSVEQRFVEGRGMSGKKSSELQESKGQEKANAIANRSESRLDTG
jgi:hypothetical protein